MQNYAVAVVKSVSLYMLVKYKVNQSEVVSSKLDLYVIKVLTIFEKIGKYCCKIKNDCFADKMEHIKVL